MACFIGLEKKKEIAFKWAWNKFSEWSGLIRIETKADWAPPHPSCRATHTRRIANMLPHQIVHSSKRIILSMHSRKNAASSIQTSSMHASSSIENKYPDFLVSIRPNKNSFWTKYKFKSCINGIELWCIASDYQCKVFAVLFSSNSALSEWLLTGWEKLLMGFCPSETLNSLPQCVCWSLENKSYLCVILMALNQI